MIVWKGSYGQSEHPCLWFEKAFVPEEGDKETQIFYGASAEYVFLYECTGFDLVNLFEQISEKGFEILWAPNGDYKKAKELLKASIQ